MRHFFLSGSFLLGVCSFSFGQVAGKHPKVLLELFTSQGCSSCLPAEKVMQQLKADSVISDGVTLLSFHVDYWDENGWKDPFSHSVFTQRQREYMPLLKTEGLFTPQLVVNGKSSFSSANKARIVREISAGLQKRFPHTLLIDSIKTNPSRVSFNYTVSDTSDSYVLNAALVTASDTTRVLAGENGGKTMCSINTVRSFITIDLRKLTGKLYLRFPPGAALVNPRIILYTQRKTDGEITGAVELAF